MKVTTNQYFKEIIPEEGMVLTDWDANDVKDFTFYEIMAVPFGFDETKLREISFQERDYLIGLQMNLNNEN